MSASASVATLRLTHPLFGPKSWIEDAWIGVPQSLSLSAKLNVEFLLLFAQI